MIESKSVEAFLSKVYAALKDLPLSEKSDMIVDLYDYIEQKSTAESKPIPIVLKEMGAPQDVAAKIQVNRQIYQWSSSKETHSRNFHKILISFLMGALVFLFLLFGAYLWRISPIVEVNQKGTSFFGGLIHFKGGNEPQVCIAPEDNKKASIDKNIAAPEVEKSYQIKE